MTTTLSLEVIPCGGLVRLRFVSDVATGAWSLTRTPTSPTIAAAYTLASGEAPLVSPPANWFLDYGDGTLFISDLNPRVETQWRMGRLELFLLGMRCIGEALEPPRGLPQRQDLPRLIAAMALIAIIFTALLLLFLVYSRPTRPTDRIPGERHSSAVTSSATCPGRYRRTV